MKTNHRFKYDSQRLVSKGMSQTKCGFQLGAVTRSNVHVDGPQSKSLNLLCISGKDPGSWMNMWLNKSRNTLHPPCISSCEEQENPSASQSLDAGASK